MIEIEDKIVSQELFEEYFCCDLSVCKGECCVEGDAGAPLEESEIDYLEANIEAIKPYMKPDGIEALKEGVFVVDSDGDYTTPLINRAECAYSLTIDGCTLCAIERAFYDNKISFKKPISCHLYPIRVKKFKNGTVGLSYHRWGICSSACENGVNSGIKVYQALKEPIIRSFGEEFYTHLCDVDAFLESGEPIEEEQ